MNEFEAAQIEYEKMQLEKRISKKFVEDFYSEILDSKEDFKKIARIESKYGNFCENMEDILKRIEPEKVDEREFNKKDEDGFVITKYKESLGVLGLIFSGDPYVAIEVISKAVMTKNAVIICTNDKMYATNKLIVLCAQRGLKKYGYSPEIVQILNSEDYEELYKHNNIIKKLLVVGDKKMQEKAVRKAEVDCSLSGYGNYDVYIEDIVDAELIKKVINVEGVNFNIYINKNITEDEIMDLGIEDYTEVESTRECIRDININSAGYSSSIFTHNGQNANDFLKLIRTKNVFVNASPTLERKLDICLNDMTYEKKVMAERILGK